MLLQITAGEGGKDSEMFCEDLLRMYSRYASSRGMSMSDIRHKDGDILVRVSGRGCESAFGMESGSHVVQRVPPTERSGRRQTSVVSVAMLPLPPDDKFELNESDVEIITQCGGGPGGQHRNKTASTVRVRHLPTGIEVKIDARCQHTNKAMALKILKERVAAVYRNGRNGKYDELRASRLRGSSAEIGGRGSKVRTYNLIDSRVVDHRTNKTTRDVKSVLNGKLEVIL